MPYHWINPEEYTMDTFLLFDRWALNYMFSEDSSGKIKQEMADALFFYPHVLWFIGQKAPECQRFLQTLKALMPQTLTKEKGRKAQSKVLQHYETFVVYAYPRVMNRVNYIRNWDRKWLDELIDVTGKVVLDVGAGTGRLAFAAQETALRVYASEPCDTLREAMRDRIKAQGITNMKVLDGIVMDLPFEDNTFDAVLSGHVVGEDYDGELFEMTRVLKPDGWIVICNGDDEFVRKTPNPELVSRGFDVFTHQSIEGGIIHNYRKQVHK